MPALLADVQRFTVASNVEVPLTIDAVDWRTALCVALQLLGHEDRVNRLVLRLEGDVVAAEDPQSGARYLIPRAGRAFALPPALAA